MYYFVKIIDIALGDQQVKGISAEVHHGEASIHASKINNPLNCLSTQGINYTVMLIKLLFIEKPFGQLFEIGFLTIHQNPYAINTCRHIRGKYKTDYHQHHGRS